MENQKTEKPNKIRIEQEALNEAAGKDRQKYDIDTRFIYYRLRDKSKNYDTNFLNNEVREAIELVHRKKQIATYYDDRTNYMRSNIKFYSLQKNKNDFWNQDCYIGGKRKKEFYIVAYDEPCVVRKKDDIKCFDLLFAIQFSLTPIDECFNFLQYHYEKSFKKNISEFTIFLDNICLEYNPILKEKHEPFYRDSIDKIVGSEIELNKNSAIQKLKWLGTPSQFSYLFLELAEKGFIEIPPTNGESSYSKYAKVCWDLFDFDKTTLENLKKELNPNKNTLTDTVRSKFTIPQLSDISKKKKK